ncbi:MAG: LppX_LprAFG lipoprotein [Thermoleophilia bacterium]|jgi:hypothetical protein|nr:LppX_LprAFG lipoprotein [Thermoleophilia bacterium]
MRRPALAALIAAILVAALALAGCGGGDGGQDLSEGLTPQELLDRSQQATAAITSYRVAANARVDVDTAPGAVDGTIGRLLADPVTIDGEGSVKRPDSVTFDLTATIGGLPVQANVTKIGGELYLTALGQDFKVGLPASQVALIRAAEVAPSLLSWMKDPREVGREEIDGVETVHLRGGVDVAAVVRDASGLLEQAPGLAGGSAPTPAERATARRQIQSALRRGEVDVWIGTEDLLPRRARSSLLLQGRTDLLPELRRVDLQIAADLSEFDEPVEITAPADAQPLDPGNLTQLAP